MGLSDHWYKNAIIYSLDVETFQDSDGDGIGDFGGLTRRLDYLSGLGVTCLWLQPFHPTPNLDNGYDVTDYYGVDPRHGTLGEFVEFAREARDRGIKLLMDLVVNHTSTCGGGTRCSWPRRTSSRRPSRSTSTTATASRWRSTST